MARVLDDGYILDDDDEGTAFFTHWDETPTAYAGSGEKSDKLGTAAYTQKLAPRLNDSISWFTFEEQVEEWLLITNLDKEFRGPALMTRMDGTKPMLYKRDLDHEQLQGKHDPSDVNAGVKYFLKYYRPKYLKNVQNIFMYRFMRLLKYNRDGQDTHPFPRRVCRRGPSRSC